MEMKISLQARGKIMEIQRGTKNGDRKSRKEKFRGPDRWDFKREQNNFFHKADMKMHKG